MAATSPSTHPTCTLFSLRPAAFPGITKMLQWSQAASTKMFSLTMNTVLAATLLHSPEDHPPHRSHNFLCLHVHSKTKITQIALLEIFFFFVKAPIFAAHQHCLGILHNVFFIIKKVCIRQEEKNFLRRLMCIIVCN